MNVRVHKRDFTSEDFADVDRVVKSWSGDELMLFDCNQDELGCIETREITFVEIRV